jgi:hypothetical protein
MSCPTYTITKWKYGNNEILCHIVECVGLPWHGLKQPHEATIAIGMRRRTTHVCIDYSRRAGLLFGSSVPMHLFQLWEQSYKNLRAIAEKVFAIDGDDSFTGCY